MIQGGRTLLCGLLENLLKKVLAGRLKPLQVPGPAKV
jgi:hypothetical protein